MSHRVTFPLAPKHTLAERSLINHNGAIIPEYGVFVLAADSLGGGNNNYYGSISWIEIL